MFPSGSIFAKVPFCSCKLPEVPKQLNKSRSQSLQPKPSGAASSISRRYPRLFISSLFEDVDLYSISFSSLYEALSYYRSSTRPQHQWPVSQKLFTLDVIYLHDRPGPENCPQKVYDALVDALEHVSEHEGYIFESGQGLARLLFKLACMLLCHPQQRCTQDDFDIPKSIARKSPPPTDATPVEESSSMPGQ